MVSPLFYFFIKFEFSTSLRMNHFSLFGNSHQRKFQRESRGCYGFSRVQSFWYFQNVRSNLKPFKSNSSFKSVHKFQPIQNYDQQLDVFEEHEEHQGGFWILFIGLVFSVLIGQTISLVEKFLNPILANGGLFDQVKEVSDPV